MKTTAISIYNASAGSGKTFTLVKEYLKIILTSNKEDAYKNILAITFTNKAVGEMKSRVLENLSEFTLESPGEKALDMMEAISEETNLNNLLIRLKSQKIIKNIIHNYASFDISTIDKFTHRVIRTFAHDLNLPSTFEITTETENLLQEAVDAILSKAGEEEELTKLLVDFTMEKADDDKSWDVTRDFIGISKLLVNENNRNEIVHFKEKTISEFISIKQKLNSFCVAAEKEIVRKSQTVMDLIKTNGLNEKSFFRSVVFNHFNKLSEGNLIINPKCLGYLEEGNRYSKATPQGQKEAVDGIAADLIKYFNDTNELLEKYFFYQAFLKNITPLSLLNTISQEFIKIQTEQNKVSISDFNALIHNEIQNQPAPFIYERMGERYRHFFIDEFQDTSEMQWENLIPLIDNALSSEELSGERGSLMLVGDPKQSIYRWRGGKAEQFIDLTKDKNPFQNPDKKVFSLDTNYRSYSEIISFNNNFFNFMSQSFENKDYKDLYEKYSFQKENNKKGGYVGITFIPKVEDSSGEDNQTKVVLFLNETMNCIQNLLVKGYEYRDIVILTRKKTAGIEVANFLTENKIPIVSSETLLIEKATEVKILLDVLKFLKNGNDRESKANFLYYAAKRFGHPMETHDFIEKGMSIPDEVELENWLQTFDVSISFKNIRKKSLYEAVENIISSFLKPTKTNAYVQYFLDIVLEKEIKNQFGIADFINFWDENGTKYSIPSPEGNNAIRIMTIHKSKGLEFPVVIFPFAEESYSNSPKDKLWLDSSEEEIGLPKVLIDNNSGVENFGANAAELYQEKKQEELLDNINILYVALTRAEEQLHIISSMNLTSKGEVASNNMSSFFIHFLQEQKRFDSNTFYYKFGNAEKVSTASKALKKLVAIPIMKDTIETASIKIAQREALMWGTKQQDAIEYGNIIHEILSYVKTEKDSEAAITKAIEEGLIQYSDQEKVKQTINSIVLHPELKQNFNENNQIWNEQPIIQKEGKMLIPDRISITINKEASIIDYKTGEFSNKHILQLETYEKALQNMGYIVIQKVLVYIGETITIKSV